MPMHCKALSTRAFNWSILVVLCLPGLLAFLKADFFSYEARNSFWFVHALVISRPNSSRMCKPKTVYLIRHAESMENKRVSVLKSSLKKIGRFSPPSCKDLKMGLQFLNLPAQVDSDVSDVGLRQIQQVGKALQKDDFVTKNGIQLVAHSPLSRARETSRGMLGCAYPDVNDFGVERVMELSLLLEKTPYEWLPGGQTSLLRRISEFEEWLGKQEEEVIAIVGHSQYFKAMLGMNRKFENCDVYRVQFVASNNSNGVCRRGKEDATKGKGVKWKALQRLFSYTENN